MKGLTKERLMKLVGMEVGVRLFNDKEYEGVLGFADDFSARHGWRKPGYFYIDDMGFKVSHVKKIWLPLTKSRDQGPLMTPEERQRELEKTDCIGQEYMR